MVLMCAGQTAWGQKDNGWTHGDTLNREVGLKEVVVKAKRQKYSKKNNPAVDFVNRLRAAKDIADPRSNHDYYQYDRYQVLSLGFNNFDTAHVREGKRLSFLKEHLDTSIFTHQPVLPLIVKEKNSHVYFRRDPSDEKEVVTGLTTSGIDDMIDEGGSVQVMLDDILREVNLYDNDVPLFRYRFVSPLSKIGPDFYMYFLTDTVTDGDMRLIELSFTPRNGATMGFSGRLYVEEGDTAMFVRKVRMGVPAAINLNFIDKLQIEQAYEKAPDGSRLKTKDHLTFSASVLPGTDGLYGRRIIDYTNHTFDAPEDMSVYDILGPSITLATAAEMDSTYWETARTGAMTRTEANVGGMMTRLRTVPTFFWGEKVLKVFASGYIGTAKKDSKWDFGPVYTFVSHNDLEGWRLKVGGMTMAPLSRHWFLRGAVAYGTKDHIWKYAGEIEYSFNEKKVHSREFPIHSIRATYDYDVDHVGQHYGVFGDNMFTALTRTRNDMITYQRKGALTYTLELNNNLSISAKIETQRQIHSIYMPFVTQAGVNHSDFWLNYGEVKLRWARGEKYYQRRNERIPLSRDHTEITLIQRFSLPGSACGSFKYNLTELVLRKAVWFSAFGHADIFVAGGKLWTPVPYTHLLMAPANISYIWQPGSFALVNPMEFLGDRYCMIDFTYRLDGLILNRIPLVKKLKLREKVGVRGWYSKLGRKFDPRYNDRLYVFPSNDCMPDMPHPYIEAYAGIENILRFFSVDYVWRVNYRGVPASRRHGVRFGIVVSF